MRLTFKHGCGAILLAGIAAGECATGAETYPIKPVRIVIGFSPGGYIDLTSRLVAGPLAAALGQQVVVDNRSGAGGVVGTEIAARAAPDGYTLTIGSIGTHAINQTLYRKLPYNVIKDFQPVARLSDAPNILAVHPSFPAKSVKELVTLAKARPGQIMYASAGAGTSTHIAAVLFEYLGHLKLVHIPYKGGGPAIIDVVAGQVPVTFATAASVSPQTKSGRLRGLGITGSQRSALLPDLPTIAEAGLPGYEMINWLGLFAPAGTPRAVVEKLSGEAIRIVRLPEVSEKLNAQGAEPSPLNTDEFTPFVKREVDKWARVVALTGMTAE